MGGGAFAIGAGYMHRFEVLVWVAEHLKKLYGVIEISLVGGSTDALVHRELVEHPIESLLVGHSYLLMTKVYVMVPCCSSGALGSEAKVERRAA